MKKLISVLALIALLCSLFSVAVFAEEAEEVEVEEVAEEVVEEVVEEPVLDGVEVAAPPADAPGGSGDRGGAREATAEEKAALAELVPEGMLVVDVTLASTAVKHEVDLDEIEANLVYFKAPTCTETGKVTWFCADCTSKYAKPGEDIVHEFVFQPLGHSWIWDYSIPAEDHPFCQTGGVAYQICEVCKAQSGKTRQVEAEHRFVHYNDDVEDDVVFEEHVKIDKNDCKNFIYHLVCVYCDEAVETVEDRGQIKNVYYAAVESTETKDLEKAGNVVIIDDEYATQKYNPTAHSYSEWNTVKEATCVAAGQQMRVCVVCGQEFIKAIPQLEHEWAVAYSELINCELVQVTFKCANCAATRVVDVPGNYHQYEVMKKQPKTLTYAADQTNGVEYFKLGAPGNKAVYTDTAILEPTCVDGGVKEAECKFCKAQRAVAVDPLGHDWSDAVATGTYTKDGETYTVYVRTCDRCNATEQIVSKDAPTNTAIVEIPVPDLSNGFAVVTEDVAVGESRTEGKAYAVLTSMTPDLWAYWSQNNFKAYARVTWVYENAAGETMAYSAIKDSIPEGDGTFGFSMQGPAAPYGYKLVSTNIVIVNSPDADQGAYNDYRMSADIQITA